jgi:hypothetical protein
MSESDDPNDVKQDLDKDDPPDSQDNAAGLPYVYYMTFTTLDKHAGKCSQHQCCEMNRRCEGPRLDWHWNLMTLDKART